ncbi:hypothetical protein C8J57DRAFT_1528596 [Mycena rebaudengoi]|nr:hypothetical protein C8J57DRAFT_1528596 [Mycena rebaudengoi]
MRSSPPIRTRILAFLYYGSKCFSMLTVLDVFPLLLHPFLILFFAGLGAFLVPVNLIIMAVIAVSGLSILPLNISTAHIAPHSRRDCGICFIPYPGDSNDDEPNVAEAHDGTDAQGARRPQGQEAVQGTKCKRSPLLRTQHDSNSPPLHEEVRYLL